VIADFAGWRAVYLSAASLMLLLARCAQAMPAVRKTPMAGSYLALMTSVFHLLMTEPTLQVRGVFALLIFAAFSVLWTALVPLSAQGLSHTQIGLFGLAGIAGALAASKAGHWADRGAAQRVTGVSLALLLFAWAPIARAEASCRCWSSGSSFSISPYRRFMSLTRV
jgi:hypothetical protein